MNFEDILLQIAPGVDAALGRLLDFIAQAGRFLGLAALYEGFFAFLGELFARWGFTFI